MWCSKIFPHWSCLICLPILPSCDTLNWFPQIHNLTVPFWHLNVCWYMTLAISGRLFLQYFDFSFRYHVVRISEEFPRNFTWLYELYNSKTYGGRMLIFFPTIYHLGDTYQYVTANITESAPSVYMFHKKLQTAEKLKYSACYLSLNQMLNLQLSCAQAHSV